MPRSSSLSTQKLGPFNIVRKVNDLTYEIELPETMKIHLVISAVHLEQAKRETFENGGPHSPESLI